jgi:regulator of sigma E protease
MELLNILLAALGIGLLIFIHELGHFLAARAAGVRVEVFSLGFGPRLWGFWWRGTDFRLSLVPFGGFVMVAGQDPSDRRYPAHESLWSKSVGRRAVFWAGGVAMNALFALVVFPIVFANGVSFVAPVVGGTAVGSPAWEAGLRAGDRVLEVQSKPMYSFENLSVEIALAGNRSIDLLVRGADGQERSVSVRPRFDADAGLYELGIDPQIVADLPAIGVVPGSPAALAGLRDGDLLQAIDGVVAGGATPRAVLARLEAGHRRIAVQVQRDGTPLAVELERAVVAGASPLLFGLTQMPRRVAGVRTGASLVDGLGLQRGDLVLAIDGLPLSGVDLATAGDPTAPTCRVSVLRDGREVVLEHTAQPGDRSQLATHVALQTDGTLHTVVVPDSAAAAAGLQSGDLVVAVDGTAVRDWNHLRDLVGTRGERPLTVRFQRPQAAADGTWASPERRDLRLGEPIEATVVARRDPIFGIVPMVARLREEVRATSFADAVRLGCVCSLDLVKQLYVTLKRIATGDVGAKNLGGIIRISQVSYQAAKEGPSWFWYLLAMLSVNLAFVNLLPVPVLDGGHLLFLLIEKVKGSPVSTKVLGYSQVVGLVFVLLLVLFVTYNDILRLF